MKVELAFDIVQDGFTRIKGQVCEYDDAFGDEMIKQGHFMRHQDTPCRRNMALYSLGCLPGQEAKIVDPLTFFDEQNKNKAKK